MNTRRKTVTVQVTAEHIAQGRKNFSKPGCNYARACPVAIATAAVFPDCAYVIASRYDIRVIREGQVESYHTPANASAFIPSFDKRPLTGTFEPFEFDLEVSA